MKRKSIWATAIGSLLVVITLSFQNCNNKQFGADSAFMNGTLGSMDVNGQIDGTVTSDICDDENEVAAGDCPEVTMIRFYAIEANGAKTFIGDTEGKRVEAVDVDGKKKYSYTFSFRVPVEQVCKSVEAYVVDPKNGKEVLIVPDASFILWGDVSKCPNIISGGNNNGGNGSNGGTSGGTNGTTNGGNTNGGTNGSNGGSGSVTIDNVSKSGQLIQVSGKCTTGTDVVASGDLYAMINKSDACVGGVYKHCDFLTKFSASNMVIERQTVGAMSSDDSKSVSGGNPPLVFTFDTFTRTGATDLAITGKCLPGSTVVLTIYNAVAATITCPSSGMYTYSGNPIIVNLTDRVMFGKMTTLFGEVNIKADVDSQAVVPSCTITETKPRTDFCTAQAGSVKGTCKVGLPVFVSIDGSFQNIGYCSSGTYEISGLLLPKLGVAHTLKIEQNSPYAKHCEASKTLSSF